VRVDVLRANAWPCSRAGRVTPASANWTASARRSWFAIASEHCRPVVSLRENRGTSGCYIRRLVIIPPR
jgi:hypothetical protein